ncbi:HNH endonuclease [Aerophototrophica crusticola]|uniref:HNH endonuclease n=1 Tax=Aerophototrophica crusticola TaxID=1709002 RepID=UPI0009526119
MKAGHIRPYAEGGEHSIPNGLLMQRDIHRLFDLGYVTVTPEYKFELSKSVKEDFSNRKEYYGLHELSILLPNNQAEKPDPKILM